MPVRVLAFSDMQTHDQLPALEGVAAYVFNTGGYLATPFVSRRKGPL